MKPQAEAEEFRETLGQKTKMNKKKNESIWQTYVSANNLFLSSRFKETTLI